MSCPATKKTVLNYFNGLCEPLGLKVYYSRKNALNEILDHVEQFPCVVVSPINSFTFDFLGRSVIAFEVGVIDLSEQDYDETINEDRLFACIDNLSAILRNAKSSENEDFYFQRADTNMQVIPQQYDVNVFGAYGNLFVKKQSEVCQY